eukprot:CAMPEP_0185740780 /NCGR_PEP_ID=MMETSP1171-20130828/38584_1 /TAXON_ID=374046 /ORGANISM="Helicotheca tamensis, Strain CCMP826" /LENGTH=374 /DNA_ID=CAMNT_0028412701 /DNA_START=80 /DNA_END=1204 /DNA_ORIENTATION=+
MNEYQHKIYKNLILLCNTRSKKFFYKDFKVEGNVYRIFNYRLAKYGDFCQPSALESRGIMFRLDNDEPVCLVAMPMEKFFNLNENPFTMNIDLSEIDEAEIKSDGSLISTYVHDSNLFLKTRGSTESPQSFHAFHWLNEKSNIEFRSQLWNIASRGYTVNMEWVAPENRIVLKYEQQNLIVLNIRRHSDGAYIQMDQLSHEFDFEIDEILNHWTERLSLPNWDDFVNKVIPSKQNMEGYVLRLKSGQRIKIKTSWYRALHKTSSKLDNPNHLFEAVLEETVDDMKAMLHDNAGAISAIIEMEEFVDNIYVSLVTAAEDFFERYNHLGRKEYVMLGKEELDKRALQLAVQKYLGREVDYKSFIKSHWKDFGWKKS